MSYILDALKKSEQERGHGNIPDVQTVHSSSLNYRSDKRAYWPYILITAVILNLVAIIYFISNKESPAVTEATKQEADVTTVKKIESNITLEKPDILDSSTAESSDDEKKSATIEATDDEAEPVVKAIQIADKKESIDTDTDRKTISSSADIIEFYDLPESIKQGIPAIAISGHVYSSNPAQRSIVINNRFMEEGEYVLDGLILYEITPEGAIFNYQGTVFNYGVVSGWQ